MDLYVNRYSIKYGFSWSEIMFKGSDWLCMVVSWECSIIENFRIHLRHVKRNNDE